MLNGDEVSCKNSMINFMREMFRFLNVSLLEVSIFFYSAVVSKGQRRSSDSVVRCVLWLPISAALAVAESIGPAQ
jgi:hypothetical protein